jgi:hypothetical protein
VYCDCFRKSYLEHLKKIDVSTREKCVSLIISEEMKEIINLIPENDLNITDSNDLSLLLNFLMTLLQNILSFGLNSEEDTNCYKKVHNRLTEINGINKLFKTFKNVTKDEHKLTLSHVIGRFHTSIVLPAEMYVIISPLIKSLNIYLEKQSFSQEEMKEVLLTLAFICFNNDLKTDILSLLYKMVMVEDFVIVQYSLIPFANLSSVFSTEDAVKLVSMGILTAFTKLFQRLTFETLKEPITHSALMSALKIVRYTLEFHTPSINTFLSSPLVPTILEIFNIAFSFSLSKHFSGVMEKILIHICCIFFVNYSIKQVEELVNTKIPQLFLDKFDILMSEMEKGRNELSFVVYHFSAFFEACINHGFFNPTSFGNNSLKSHFEKFNSISRLCNAFILLKSLNSQLNYVKESLNYLLLAVCYLLKNQTPPIICGPILQYCYDLKDKPSSLHGFYFPKRAKCVWNNMKNPFDIMLEWKFSFTLNKKVI